MTRQGSCPQGHHIAGDRELLWDTTSLLEAACLYRTHFSKPARMPCAAMGHALNWHRGGLRPSHGQVTSHTERVSALTA